MTGPGDRLSRSAMIMAQQSIEESKTRIATRDSTLRTAVQFGQANRTSKKSLRAVWQRFEDGVVPSS